MNYIDLLLLIVLVAGTVRGFLKGFIYELAVLGALFLGVYAAFRLSHVMTPWLSRTFDMNAGSAGFTSSLILFIAVMVGIIFLAKLLTGLADIAALGIFNKILGAMFGFAKHLLLLSVFIYFFNQLDVRHHYLEADKKADTRVYYPVMKVAPALFPVMKELKIELAAKAEDVRQRAEDSRQTPVGNRQ